MGDLIVVGILIVLVGAALYYILKEKKKGIRCIGCPSAGCCPGKKCSDSKEKSHG